MSRDEGRKRMKNVCYTCLMADLRFVHIKKYFERDNKFLNLTYFLRVYLW